MTPKLNNIIESINKTHDNAVSQLEEDRNILVNCLKEWADGPNPYFKEYLPSVLNLIDKYLEWHNTSGETRHWKHQMFGKVFPCGSWRGNEVLGPLCHFISHEVYDDGSFSVVWYKNKYEERTREVAGKQITLPTGKYLGQEVTSEDDFKNGYPVVEYDFYGTQDPGVIVRAMEKYEHNQKLCKEYHRELDAKLKKRIERLRDSGRLGKGPST